MSDVLIGGRLAQDRRSKEAVTQWQARADTRFDAYLKRSIEIVRGWPEWCRNLLGKHPGFFEDHATMDFDPSDHPWDKPFYVMTPTWDVSLGRWLGKPDVVFVGTTGPPPEPVMVIDTESVIALSA